MTAFVAMRLAPGPSSESLQRTNPRWGNVCIVPRALSYVGLEYPAGRLRGSRNRLSEAVICALLRDFSKHGEKAIAEVRRTQPGVYLKVLALLVPREHKVEYGNSLKNWTDEEIEAGIDLIKQMLESRAVASGAVIEGTAEPVSMLAHAELKQPQRKRPNRLLEHADTAVGPKERKPRQRKMPSPASA
jgi:hypothetical protein